MNYIFIILGDEKRKFSDLKFSWTKTHQNVLYAQKAFLYQRTEFAIYKYDKNQEYKTTSDSSQHITRIDVKFEENFCIIQDFIVMIRMDKPQLYFFTLEGDFHKTETLPILKDKEIFHSYNEGSMIVRDYEIKELWVVKLNGEATKINIDAQKPWRPCVSGKNLFVYCWEKKAIIKYISN